MILIVGLGNVGGEYIDTRHNVGFHLVDELAKRLELDSFAKQEKFSSEITADEELILVKPLTMMNASGKAVQAIKSFYKIKVGDIYVVHDDLDIGLGGYKIHLGKGPELHNGVNSVIDHLGTGAFWRVRIGVDNRVSEEGVQGERIPGEAYVLQKFSPEELSIVIDVVGAAADDILSQIEEL